MGAAAVTGVANYDMMIIGEVLESTDGLGVFVRPDSPIVQATGYNPSYPNVLTKINISQCLIIDKIVFSLPEA